MEKEKFSEDWKEAFEGAGVSPSDSVWSTIDLKLENEKMKRRVVYYQRIAAASILFALLFGIWGNQYYGRDNGSSLASTQKTEALEELKESPTSTSLSENNFVADSAENNSLAKNSNSITKADQMTRDAKNTKSYFIVNETTGDVNEDNFISENQLRTNQRENNIEATNNLFNRLSSFLSPQLSSNELPLEKKKRELKQMLFESQAELPTASKNQKDKKENLWLALGAGAGSYNPGTSSQSQTASGSFSNASTFQDKSLQSKPASTGASYSMGISVGKKISERWVMQTGINYMNQTLAYTSNFASYTASNEMKASVADYVDGSSALTATQPYKVNSSMEFVSVPLQAGYLILDRKFGVQLNAGIATDIFLRNTLQDQSGQSSKYSEGSGENSPYRSINWAGLASTELSYKIAKQYRLSLMPGMRYSFQPSLKSPASGMTSPFVVDLGFRFKYIFK